jgi:hypothetical protein
MEAHVAAKGAEIRDKYGPRIGWHQLLQILADRNCVRYPCVIVFDAAPLHEGEFAHPVAKGARPEEGFTIFVHPYFATQLERLPHIVLYQLVLVNYGDFASADDAEIFGSSALSISRDDYYRAICEVADELAEDYEPISGSAACLQTVPAGLFAGTRNEK